MGALVKFVGTTLLSELNLACSFGVYASFPWSRMAASALIGGLAPENLGWLAHYFSAQLVGWGLAPPEETDSDLMALVAPAGEKGLATLQKLHRRISTSSSGEVRHRWLCEDLSASVAFRYSDATGHRSKRNI